MDFYKNENRRSRRSFFQHPTSHETLIKMSTETPESKEMNSTGPFEPDGYIFPMHFSQTRYDQFYTTSALTGKVIKVENPRRVFQTTLGDGHKKQFRKTKFKVPTAHTVMGKRPSDLLIPLTEIETPIPDFLGKDKAKFWTLLKAIRDIHDERGGRNHKDYKHKNEVLRTLVRVSHAAGAHKVIASAYHFQKPKEGEDSLWVSRRSWSKCADFNDFTANVREEWDRVKRLFILMMKMFDVSHILDLDIDDYTGYFTDLGPNYALADSVMSYAILSCVHFRLFLHREDEVSFYDSLHKSTQKTKFIMDYITDLTQRDAECRATMQKHAQWCIAAKSMGYERFKRVTGKKHGDIGYWVNDKMVVKMYVSARTVDELPSPEEWDLNWVRKKHALSTVWYNEEKKAIDRYQKVVRLSYLFQNRKGVPFVTIPPASERVSRAKYLTYRNLLRERKNGGVYMNPGEYTLDSV